MLNTRTLLVTGVVAYIVCLLILFPLSGFQKGLTSAVAPIMQVQSIEGSIWSADMSYQAHDLPSTLQQGQLEWGMSIVPLFWLNVGGTIKATHPGLSLEGLISAGVDSLSISGLEGVVEARFLNQILNQQQAGAQVAGELLLDELSVFFERSTRQFEKVEGQLLYEGGRATIQRGSSRKNITLPALVGHFSLADDGLQLEVMLQTSDQVLVTVKLKNDGWGELAVSKAFFKAIGQSDLISDVNVKQKIF